MKNARMLLATVAILVSVATATGDAEEEASVDWSEWTAEDIQAAVVALAEGRCAETDTDCAGRWTDYGAVLRANGVDGSIMAAADLDDLTDISTTCDSAEPCRIHRIWAKVIVEHFASITPSYNGHPFADPALDPDTDYYDQAGNWARFNSKFTLFNDQNMVPNIEIALVMNVVAVILLLMQSCMADWYDEFYQRNNFTWISLTFCSVMVLRFGLTIVDFAIIIGVWVLLVSLNCLRAGRKRCKAPKPQALPELEEEQDEPESKLLCGCIDCDMCSSANDEDRKNLKSFVKRHRPQNVSKITESILQLHDQYQKEEEGRNKRTRGGRSEKMRRQDSGDAPPERGRPISEIPDIQRSLTQLSTGLALHGNSKKKRKKGPQWLKTLQGVVREDMTLFQYLSEDRSFDAFFADSSEEKVQSTLATYPGNGKSYTNFTLGTSGYFVLMTTVRGTLFMELIPICFMMCLYMVMVQWLFQRYCFEDAWCIYKFEALVGTLEGWHDYVFWFMAFSVLAGSGDMIEKWHDIQDCCWDIRKEVLNNAVIFSQACGNKFRDRRFQFYRYLQVFHFYAYITPPTIITKAQRPPLVHALLPMINSVFKNNGLLTEAEFQVLEEHKPPERWQVLVSWIMDMYKQLETELTMADGEPMDISGNVDFLTSFLRDTPRSLHEKLQQIRPFSHQQLLEYIIYAYLVSLPITSTYNQLAAGPTVIDYQLIDYIFAMIIAMFAQGLMKFQILADQPFAYAQADTFKPISLMRDTEQACLLYLRKPWSETGRVNLRFEPPEDSEGDEGGEEAEAAEEEEAPAPAKEGNRMPRAYKDRVPTTTGWFAGH